MKNTFVLGAIKAAFALEISNHYTTTDDAIIVDFPNHTQAIIKAPKIDKVKPQAITTITAEHTYHYAHQHDVELQPNPDNKPSGKFALLSIDDCCSYLDDACQTFLDAKFDDFELTFATGEVYLITIEQR